MEKYGFYLVKKLLKAPFFKRFDAKTLMKYLREGTPEMYCKNDVVYLKERIGVIYSGSIRIISHSRGMLTPYTEVRHLAGKILGHESDNGITTNS